MDLLRHIHDAGLSIRAEGDRLVVSPRERLTDELREAIRTHKSELTAALNGHRLAPRDRAAILAWLDRIGETDPFTIATVLAGCSRDRGALAYFLDRAREVPQCSMY